MARQDLLSQAGARSWHANDEYRHRRGVTEAASLTHRFGSEQFSHPLELRQCRGLIIDDLFPLERIAVDEVIERPFVLPEIGIDLCEREMEMYLVPFGK